MIRILNQKLDLITANKFRYLGPIISLASDLLLINYINKVLLPLMITNELIYQVAQFRGVDPNSISIDSIEAIKQATHSSMSTAIFYLILYHIIIYLLCMKNIKWATTYIKGYCFSAAFLSVFEIVGIYNITGRIYYITPITMLLYFFVYYGYKYFKKKEE